MSEPQKIFHDNALDMAGALAGSIVQDLKAAENPFLILPGGSSPQLLIKMLARTELDWNGVTITTTDERLVPFEDEHSNAGQIKRLFASENVDIASVWLRDGEAENLNWPSTVTVLGMGLDGHFASLFPEAPVTGSGKVIEAKAPNSPYERLSLTLEAILDTKRLILLVPDAEKKSLCEEILSGNHQNLPLATLIHRAGKKLELHIVSQDQ